MLWNSIFSNWPIWFIVLQTTSYSRIFWVHCRVLHTRKATCEWMKNEAMTFWTVLIFSECEYLFIGYSIYDDFMFNTCLFHFLFENIYFFKNLLIVFEVIFVLCDANISFWVCHFNLWYILLILHWSWREL